MHFYLDTFFRHVKIVCTPSLCLRLDALCWYSHRRHLMLPFERLSTKRRSHIGSYPFLSFAWTLLSLVHSQECFVSLVSINQFAVNSFSKPVGSIVDCFIKERHLSEYACSRKRITSSVFSELLQNTPRKSKALLYV